MSEIVVPGDTDSIEDIQDYLQSFNKEIGDTDQNAVPTAISASTAVATPNAAGQTNQVAITDAIYTLDGKEITGNIVLTDQVAGEQTDQSGNFPSTFVVMNDQQYMLIMSNDSEQPATDNEQQTTFVAVAAAEEQTNDGTTAASTTNQNVVSAQTSSTTNTETPRRTRGMFRQKQRIKEEVFDDDTQNDMSVYDFNEQPNKNASSNATASSGDTPNKNKVPAEDDPDYKTPAKRGRPIKTESGRKVKSGSGSLVLNTSTGSSNSNVHVCTYCSYTSTKRYLLSRHLKSHSEDRPHKCGICERGFKTLASLQNHVNTHTGVRPHQCKFCEAAFTTSGELVRHIRYRHTHEKPHRCTECDYASVELSKLKRHMRCHTGERPYQCPHCTYASPDTYKLKRHLRIHTGEKPYLCDVCQQRFTQSNSLKAHKLIHTGNKPIFKCEFCPTTCGRKTDLRIHVQKLHTSDKMLTCKRCDQSFPDRYQFKLHLKTHEGEKCFKCDLCSYASVSARHLESHMLIHTDQKPFICDICQLSFRQKQLLKRHKNLYHNPTYVPPVPKEKTHECSQCSKAFRHKGNLIRHMSLHDPDSKNNIKQDPDAFENSQLIDDEIYEDEDDYETPDDTPNVSIVDGSTILDSTATTDGTISITLDPQTQQLINSSGNEQLMLVVVPESGDATANANGQQAIVSVSATQTASTPRIISRSGRITRSAAKANEVQGLFDSVTDAKSALVNTSTNNGNDTSDDVSLTQQAPQLSFDNSAVETINMEEQIRKQKDLDACFGFKDEDDEDDIILSMPTVHGQ